MNSQSNELARLEVRDTAGVFAARQLGRGLAAVLALEQQDQIRVATALSEVSRSAVTAGRTAVITFGIDRADLLVTVAVDGELSDELEQTNRGVVALYAELDEKSERLRAASESKDRFWANVSHELRTPLNSIIGLTRLLAEPAPDGTVLDAERLYQTELIRNSGTTLLTLVNDLLDVAKAESGQLRVDPAQVDLPALFGRLRGLARPMAEGKPVEVIVGADDPDTPVTILTDEVALTSILRN